jgi:hypothetical protein
LGGFALTHDQNYAHWELFWLFQFFLSILEFLNSFLWTSPTQQGLSPVQIYTIFYLVMLGTSRPGKSKQSQEVMETLH